MSFLSFLSEMFLRTRIDQGESLTILRRTYQTATSRNRLWRSTIPDLSTAISQPLWRPFKQPNRVSAGVSIRPVQSDKETIDNTGSRPTRIVSYTNKYTVPYKGKLVALVPLTPSQVLEDQRFLQSEIERRVLEKGNTISEKSEQQESGVVS